MTHQTAIDGFWLPQSIHSRLITPATEYASLSLAAGRPSSPGSPVAVTVRWPLLSIQDWQLLFDQLAENRRRLPGGEVLWQRLVGALQTVSSQVSAPLEPQSEHLIAALPKITGYSPAMLGFALQALDLFALEQMPAIYRARITRKAISDWQPVPGLPGRLRFFPDKSLERLRGWLPGYSNVLIHSRLDKSELVVGFGAGNVPGTALLIGMLALSTALSADQPPAILIKNSQHEPVFSPFVLRALERADPELVAGMAILIWDYTDVPLQEMLLSRADQVLIAASDETIEEVRAQVGRAASRRGRSIHFHPHGHKVSFTAIGQEMLAADPLDPVSGRPVVERVALMAALDSILWDQQGCLSSRIHFVETVAGNEAGTLAYAGHLQSALSRLASLLPRGAWPKQHLHDQFDHYKQLEAAGLVQVLSDYDDEFVVTIDRRAPDLQSFSRQVNSCHGRVLVVRPVNDLREIASLYLRFLPARNLQSLSVALGKPGTGLDDRILDFATACGECGVTAIRTVGRGAFPQLAYSWDGQIPLDLVAERPAGHFTTIEFDDPYGQILETSRLLDSRLPAF